MRRKDRDSDLYKRIDEIVWNDWDPIGMKWLTESNVARDEYYSYLPSIYTLLLDGCDVKKLSKYLDHIETANIGLSGNPQKNIEIAQKLILARDEFHPI